MKGYLYTIKCRRCGAGLKETWSFCPACGTKKGSVS